MRILAIRGSNLASLYGNFEVDFTAEPFASAGLFVITGATGAGKSTLLDALCLALFNSTPRLAKSGGAMVGRADQASALRVSSTDVRGILSRGRSHGFAEVDFQSQDDHRWRARWEVHRAHNRVEGRLQQQKLLLEDLDSGNRVGGTNTEVLEAIRQQVGLSFDQFRRSALLAQGDFAAFLHAETKERAELLEKITGTAIYAQLSEAAYARAKDERDTLESLNQQHASLGLLSPRDRQELETAEATASATLSEAKQGLQAAEDTVQWYVKLADFKRREEEGGTLHEEASRSWQQSAPRRQTFDLVQAAQPLRPLLAHFDSSIQRRDEARKQVEIEGHHLEEAREAMKVATETLTARRSGQQEAKAKATAQAPELEKAALLDHRLSAAEDDMAEANAAAEEAASSARRAAAARQATADAVDEEQKKLATAERWLKNHPEAQALSGGWDHLQSALEENEQASKAAEEVAQKLPALREAADQAALAARQARKQVQAAEHKLEEAQTAVDSAEGAIPEGRRESLEEERKIFELRRDTVRQAEQALAEARRIQSQKLEAETAALKAAEKEQRAREEVEQQRTAMRQQEIRFDEAERALRASQAIRDLDDRRGELVAGEPCPLCGSTSHPYQQSDPLSDALTEQRQRLQELRGRGQEITVALATAQEQMKSSQTEAERQAKEAAEADHRLLAPQKLWGQVLATLAEVGLPEVDLAADPLEEDAAASLESAVSTTQQALVAFHRLEEEFKALEKEAREARKARDAARDECDRLGAILNQARDHEQQTSEALVSGQRRQEEAHQKLATTLKSLETSLNSRPGWKEKLAADRRGFRRACDREVSDFREHNSTQQQARAALAELQPQAAREAARAEAARDAATAAQQRQQKLLTTTDALRRERKSLLGGQAVDIVKQFLDQASAQADQELESALQLERDARAGLKAAEAKLEGAQQQLHRESSALEEAQEVLQEALEIHGIDLETLRQRLHFNKEWCDTEERHFEQLREAMQGAASVLADRRQRREEHEKTGRPQVSAEEATAELERAAEEHQGAEEKAQELTLRIKQDDTARTWGSSLAAEISKQESQAARWATLNEVIGSSSGHKFRKFAQGLTLDSLLGYANAHLQDLAPRYRLDRVPGEDLELQVIDLDMGEEVRSINTLSGGETFLASLALALGLSSLSASETPVESLFIDEGFGTLDPETLEVALSALDTLQASGRQVGIISHVQDLGQRIGVQVHVAKLGAGRSRVETIFGFES